MRRIVRIWALGMLVVASAGTVQAGVYNLDPPRKYPSDFQETNAPQPLWQVINYIGELRTVRDPDPSTPQKPPEKDSLRQSYLEQHAALQAKRQEGSLITLDRINLSACLIRLGRTTQAADLLEESLRVVPPDDSYRFLLLLHLAAIQQDDDNLLQRAIDIEREALQAWPTFLPCWNRWESAWYRHAEHYALALMELRKREQVQLRGRRPSELPPPDRLFPLDERDVAKQVQFIGDSGEYEAGGIAMKQLDRLPRDADQIVLQLLLWRPHDARLYWLFGEMLNARGQVDWAYKLLNSVSVDMQYRNRELGRHVKVLKPAFNPYTTMFTDSTASGQNLRNQALLLNFLTPRGALLTPGVGALANEIGGVATATYAGVSMNTAQSFAPPPAENAKSSPAGALPDWRPVVVSFVTGIVVALLGLLQWQQWRRRKKVLSSEF